MGWANIALILFFFISGISWGLALTAYIDSLKKKKEVRILQDSVETLTQRLDATEKDVNQILIREYERKENALDFVKKYY